MQMRHVHVTILACLLVQMPSALIAESDTTVFLRGDCNSDLRYDVADGIFLLDYLFNGSSYPACKDACDANDESAVDVSDTIFILSHLFNGGPQPPAPYPGFGIDPTDTDPLDCQLGQFEGEWVSTRAGSLNTDNSLFYVTMLEGNFVYHTPSFETNIHSHYVSPESADWQDYELRGRMRIEDPGGGVGVTFLSGFPGVNGYYRLRTFNARGFHIAPHGTSEPSGDIDSGVVPLAGLWYSFVLRVRSDNAATRILASVWPEGSSQPATWQINCVDSSPTHWNTGTIGCWSMGPGKKYWDGLSLNSASLPLPDIEDIVSLDLRPSRTRLFRGETVNLRAVTVRPGGEEDVTDRVTFFVDRPDALEIERGAQATGLAIKTGTVRVSARLDGLDSPTLSLEIYEPPVEGELELKSSISQYGITWEFDAAYPVGRFVSGDYWVVGPARIIRITPDASGGRNGSMLNPVAGAGTGYDSRITGHDSELRASVPLTLRAGDSLVSTISHSSPGPYVDLIGHSTSASHAFLRAAAVLTCVESPLGPGYFRPPYVGSARPLYHVSSLRRELLTSVAPSSGGFTIRRISSKTPPEQFARYFQRPWILHGRDWLARFTHPTENMPNYHREIYNIIADAALILLCDYDDKEDLLIGFVQLGIDAHYTTRSGPGDSALHRWPGLFAGLLLDDAAMKGSAYRYRTRWMTYRAGTGSSPHRSQQVDPNRGWTGATVLFRQDPGAAEHEHLHPSEWGRITVSGAGIRREAYRRSNSYTWPGAILAARLMNATSTWNNSTLFDYVDRWMTEPDVQNLAFVEDLWNTSLFIRGGTCGSEFVKNMWARYR